MASKYFTEYMSQVGNKLSGKVEDIDFSQNDINVWEHGVIHNIYSEREHNSKGKDRLMYRAYNSYIHDPPHEISQKEALSKISEWLDKAATDDEVIVYNGDIEPRIFDVYRSESARNKFTNKSQRLDEIIADTNIPHEQCSDELAYD